MGSGTADKAKGRIKKAVGDLTDDADLKQEGQIDETSGKVKDATERGVNAVRDALKGKKRR
jgi:uncharacterized protein YjbJ (UPF0337 family)